MAESLNIQHVSAQLDGSSQAGTAMIPLFKAPVAAFGGAVRILHAAFQAGAATGAGTAYTLTLVKGGTLGTVLGGTVAAAIGGTASTWTAGQMVEFTLTEAQSVIEAGTWLTARKLFSGIDQAASGIVYITYTHGN